MDHCALEQELRHDGMVPWQQGPGKRKTLHALFHRDLWFKNKTFPIHVGSEVEAGAQ